MFEVKHYGFLSNGAWTLLRARNRLYSTMLDAYAQARTWVDAEGGQAQIFEGICVDDLYENGRLINVYENGRFWR